MGHKAVSKSKIEWLNGGRTWNFVRGCRRVSPECLNCYAERQAARWRGEGKPYEGLVEMTATGPRWTGVSRVIWEKIEEPLHWTKPCGVFPCSMSDIFYEDVPDEALDKAFAVMALTPRNWYQILTKRPERMRDYVRGLHCRAGFERLEAAARAMGYSFRYNDLSLLPWPIPNIGLGVSAGMQDAWNERVPILLNTPAAVRTVSVEPMLEAIYPDQVSFRETGISPFLHWIIAGFESGPGCRPGDNRWLRTLRDWCATRVVPFFLKQLGGYPDKRGGEQAVLDGRTWQQFPRNPYWNRV